MEHKHFALKKLLEAVEKELLHKPSRKTLNHLSLLAGFQSWDDFQKTLRGDDPDKDDDASPEPRAEGNGQKLL